MASEILSLPPSEEPELPESLEQLPVYLAGWFRSLQDTQTQIIRHLERLNGQTTKNVSDISRLQGTCESRGDTCGTQQRAVIGDWKVGLIVGFAILVAGALMGTEGAKLLVGAFK